ncbi:MAG: hypothetical protein AB1420_01235 [Bacillota bacterium]
MLWTRYKHVITVFLIASLLSLLLAFTSTSRYLVSNILTDNNLKAIKTLVNNSNEEVIVQKLFTVCGHIELVEKIENLGLKEIDEANLSIIFPPEDDWIIENIEGKWIVTQPVEKLCAVDLDKRHLRIVDNFISVYQGPPYFKDSLLFITDISIWDIPTHWREQIINGNTVFENEKELLQALDTLDEFR